MTFCPQCGKPVAPTEAFCTACGSDVVHPPATPGAAAPAAAPTRRPPGVGIIGGAMIVLGAFFLFVFVGGLYLSSADPASWSDLVDQTAQQVELSPEEIEPILRGMLVAGSIAAALAVVAGIGALMGKRWAWILMLAFMGLNALGALLQLPSVTGILGVLVSALVIWYFLRPEVKAYFARR